jgi:hypothetical protein
MKALIAPCVLMVVALAAFGLTMAEEPTCSDVTSAPSCCPKCGCRECLVPICHSYCTTKSEKKYRYYCKCDVICIPDHCPCWLKCWAGGCENGSCGQQGCGNGDCESGKCSCLIKEVHKLVKVPYTVETPVRKCTIEWVCPKCGCNCGCTEQSDSVSAPAAPLPPSPSAPQKSALANPTSPAMRDY